MDRLRSFPGPAKPPILALLLLSALTPAAAGSATALKIKPGPVTQSPEELALTSGGGSVGAVILVDETERDQVKSIHRRHFRAKIVAAQGRELGNIELPCNDVQHDVLYWWGRVIPPEGKPRELLLEDLVQPVVFETRWGRVRSVKAVLPGVDVGCVIDYGWDIKEGTGTRSWLVNLQRSTEIRSLAFRWVPSDSRSSGWRLSHTNGLDVHVEHDDDAVLIRANNIPPVVEEPLMPPDQEARATATLYYLDLVEGDPKDFWNTKARSIAKPPEADKAAGEAIESLVKEMALPEATETMTKLQKAYEWVDNHFQNIDLQTAEDLAESQEAGPWKIGGVTVRRSMATVIKDRWGTTAEIVALYVALAQR